MTRTLSEVRPLTEVGASAQALPGTSGQAHHVDPTLRRPGNFRRLPGRVRRVCGRAWWAARGRARRGSTGSTGSTAR